MRNLVTRRTGPALLAVLLPLVFSVVGMGADDPTSKSEAVEALSATVDVERTLLEQDLGEHRRLASRRNAALNRLASMYAGLDAAVGSGESSAPDRIKQILEQLESLEAERRDLVTSQRILAERILERLRRLELLEARVTELSRRAKEVSGPLEGTWDVVLLPGGQSGVFQLKQSGTLVNGTYRLDGGWSGSLQGTLVNRKVFLVRIDSKRGRSGEFEGYLSGDGSRIRGSWTNYELTSPQGSAGQWSAVRRSGRP